MFIFMKLFTQGLLLKLVLLYQNNVPLNDDLSLDSGVIARRPSPATVENLSEMKKGMERAIKMVRNSSRG